MRGRQARQTLHRRVQAAGRVTGRPGPPRGEGEPRQRPAADVCARRPRRPDPHLPEGLRPQARPEGQDTGGRRVQAGQQHRLPGRHIRGEDGRGPHHKRDGRPRRLRQESGEARGRREAQGAHLRPVGEDHQREHKTGPRRVRPLRPEGSQAGEEDRDTRCVHRRQGPRGDQEGGQRDPQRKPGGRLKRGYPLQQPWMRPHPQPDKSRL